MWILGTPGVWYMAEWYGQGLAGSGDWLIRTRRRRR
jgi:hypothetical protein